MKGHFLGTIDDAWLVIRACQAKKLPFCDPLPEKCLHLSGFVYVLEDEAYSYSYLDAINWTLDYIDGDLCVSHSITDVDLKRKDAVLSSDNNVYRIISFYRLWETVNRQLSQPTKHDSFEDDPWFKIQSPLHPMEKIRLQIEVTEPNLIPNHDLTFSQQLEERQSVYKQLVMLIILGWAEESDHQRLIHQNTPLPFPQFPAQDDYWLLSQRPMFGGKSQEELEAQTGALFSLLFQVATPSPAFLPLMDRSFTPLQNRDIFFEIFRLGVPTSEIFCWPGEVMLDDTARLFGTPRDCWIEKGDPRLVDISSAFGKPPRQSRRSRFPY